MFSMTGSALDPAKVEPHYDQGPVLYSYSMVIPSFCVIKQHHLGNYCGMAVNYHGIYVTNIIKYYLT